MKSHLGQALRHRQAAWLYHRLRQIGLRTINVRARLGIRRHVVMGPLALAILALAGCGTSHHHDDAQPAPQTQKTTDDGPAVERVIPPPCDGEHHHEHESEAL